MDRDALLERYKDLPNRNVWVNEALFGYEHIQTHLDTLKGGSRILEVGSGSGILLSLIQEHHPELVIEGLEPFGDGFSQLRSYHDDLREKNICIESIGYEDVTHEKTYDLIFLVNVFEHLPDWSNFLEFIKTHLSEQGVCVILCPNYGFPYESHFGLPIILTKDMTYSLFQKKIHSYETKCDCTGLWQSLNFVKLSKVRKATKHLGLQLYFDTGIVSAMIERLNRDAEFSSRHRVVSFLAKMVKALGALKLLKFGWVQNIAPYMKLEIRK